MEDFAMIFELTVTYILYVFTFILWTSFCVAISRWLWGRNDTQQIKELKELREENKQLHNRVEVLKEEKKELSNEIRVPKDENKQLRNENKQLREENKQLQNENQTQRGRMIVLENKAQTWDTIVAWTQHFRAGNKG